LASPNPERTFGQAKNFRCRPILTVRRAVSDWPQFAFAVVPGVGHESPLSRQRRAIAPIGLTLIGVRIVDLARRLNCTLGFAPARPRTMIAAGKTMNQDAAAVHGARTEA
jgi:hypothetical protein